MILVISLAFIFHLKIMKCIGVYLLSVSVLDTYLAVNIPDTISKKIFLFTILGYGAIFFQVYSAGLTSVLTVNDIHSPINSFRDLVEHPSYKVHVYKGASTHVYLQSNGSNEQSSHARLVYDRQLDSNGQFHNFYGSLKDAEDNMLSNANYIAFIPNVFAEMQFDHCAIIASREKYNLFGIGFPFTQNSPYLGLFNFQVKQLIENGHYQKMKDKAKKHSSVKSCNADKPITSLSPYNVLHLFICIVLGCSLSVLTLIGEVIFRKLRFLT